MALKNTPDEFAEGLRSAGDKKFRVSYEALYDYAGFALENFRGTAIYDCLSNALLLYSSRYAELIKYSPEIFTDTIRRWTA